MLIKSRRYTSHIDQTMACLQEMICTELCLTIRLVAEDLGLSTGACHKILTEYLQVRLISAKFMFRLSTLKQKDDQTDFQEQIRNDPNFMCLMMKLGCIDVTKKQQMFCQWQTASSPLPKRAPQVKSTVKTRGKFVH